MGDLNTSHVNLQQGSGVVYRMRPEFKYISC